MSNVIDNPLVSVVIPAFNAEATIGETIESVLAQSYPNIEIIVVDDASTDETIAQVQKFGDKVSLYKKPHGGIGSTRNYAHARAQGKYIAWLDSDDLARPERLLLQVNALEQHPELSLVSANFCAFNESGWKQNSYLPEYYTAVAELGGVSALYPEKEAVFLANGLCELQVGSVLEGLVYGNFIHPPTVMFPRKLLAQIDPLLEDISSSVDWYFLARLAELGKAGLFQVELIDYRLSARQLSSPYANPASALNRLRVFEKIAERYREQLYRCPERYSNALARLRIDASDALIPQKRAQARFLWWKSMCARLLIGPQLKVLVKLLTPAWIFRIKRAVH